MMPGGGNDGGGMEWWRVRGEGGREEWGVREGGSDEGRE